MSAGRICDRLGEKAKAKIVFVIPGGAIYKITKDGKTETIKEEKISEEA